MADGEAPLVAPPDVETLAGLLDERGHWSLHTAGRGDRVEGYCVHPEESDVMRGYRGETIAEAMTNALFGSGARRGS